MLTRKMNQSNIDSIRHQIQNKIGSKPYYSTVEDAKSIVTDMDHFPYTRYFRGEYKSSIPRVFEREAGWRPLRDSCYEGSCVPDRNPRPNHCFETACSTTFPCIPEVNKRPYSFRMNEKCILEYR